MKENQKNQPVKANQNSSLKTDFELNLKKGTNSSVKTTGTAKQDSNKDVEKEIQERKHEHDFTTPGSSKTSHESSPKSTDLKSKVIATNKTINSEIDNKSKTSNPTSSKKS